MKNMWTEIINQKSIEDFMKKTDTMEDWETLDIISLKYEKHSLSMIVENTTFGRLEMFFEGVRQFSRIDYQTGFYTYCHGSFLQIRTDLCGQVRHDKPLIVWTDNYCVKSREDILNGEKYNIQDKIVVVAERMKYRFIGIAENINNEYSLKKIVEENYLVEIAWDKFWENFDSYIEEDRNEALQYGITDRNSIKPYFESYALKHFPDSSETFIVMTIKFYSAENNKYLGYYALVFNMNLEITDDFFVIE